jgi:hypothetical protein
MSRQDFPAQPVIHDKPRHMPMPRWGPADFIAAGCCPLTVKNGRVQYAPEAGVRA